MDPPPCPREEPERDPRPRPSRRLPQGPRRTSEPAPTRQDAAQIAPSDRRASTNRSGMGGHALHGQNDASEARFVACPGKAEGRNGAERPPALQAPPRSHKRRARRTCPPPARPPAHERHGPAPRRAAPTGRADQGDREGPPHPHARAHSTCIADPDSPPSGRAVGGEGAPDPRRASQQWKAPPRGSPSATPTTPSQVGGNRTRPPSPKHARQSKGPGQDTRRGTDNVERPYQRPVPGPREVRTPHHLGGGGADAAGARAHTHAKGMRGLPEGQPDRARGTHRPRGMAYQRARVRDSQKGRAATRSAGHAGREGGNERDTTPGTGPNPPNRPRAPRTHGRGTAPAKAVVAHSATPQPLG